MNVIYNNIDEFIKLEPRYYTFLKSISFNRNFDENESRYDIEMILVGCSPDKGSLRMLFKESFGIKIGYIEGMMGLFINIFDIKNLQIEGGTYQVSDEEESSFSFYCKEFLAELTN